MTNDPEGASAPIPAPEGAEPAAPLPPAAPAAPPAARSAPPSDDRPRSDDSRRDDRPPRRDDRDDDDRDDRRGGGRGRFGARRRGCEFCADKVEAVDYKDAGTLRRYVNDHGKIEARRKGGICGKHQREVSRAIKRARHVALLGYTAEHVRLTGVAAGRGGRR